LRNRNRFEFIDDEYVYSEHDYSLTEKEVPLGKV